MRFAFMPGRCNIVPTARGNRREPEGMARTLKKNRTMNAAETVRQMGSPVVEFEHVTKVYDDGTVGLENASTVIREGEFVFLVGPTGCGKSTFIRLLMKEFDATEGHLFVAGRDITRLDKKRVPLLRRNVGAVFQDFKLLSNRTVYDNVAYSLLVTGASRTEIRQKVPHILRLVGLSTKLHNYPDQLSGGEQQRVSIARAFVNHPPLLICDEPTGNLDPETSLGIMQLIYRINRTGTTVIVATHDKQMVDRMRRRVIELRDSHIIRDERAAGYTREFTAVDPDPEHSDTRIAS
jgi:cell division transport system ATP-binding protein